MDYTTLEIDELKEIAKNKGLKVGNIGKEKLIGKLLELDKKNISDDSTAINDNNDSKIKNEELSSTSSVLNMINESVDSVASQVTVKASSRKQEEVISSDEEIAVRSITLGGTTWVSPKTNAHYRWNEIGAIEYIPFGELVTMNNTKRAFLFKPMIILLDERAIKYFRLQETYEKVAQIHNLKEIFDTNNLVEISKVLDTIIRVNMRDVAISKIRDMRKNGELTNIDIIQLVEKKLCFDLSDDKIAD